jgi:hypothetical protein
LKAESLKQKKRRQEKVNLINSFLLSASLAFCFGLLLSAFFNWFYRSMVRIEGADCHTLPGSRVYRDYKGRIISHLMFTENIS